MGALLKISRIREKVNTFSYPLIKGDTIGKKFQDDQDTFEFLKVSVFDLLADAEMMLYGHYGSNKDYSKGLAYWGIHLCPLYHEPEGASLCELRSSYITYMINIQKMLSGLTAAATHSSYS